MDTPPFVTVVIPCLNEEWHIRRCLDSIIANDYPADRLELLVVDGMSKDKTRAYLRPYSERYPFIKVLDNHKTLRGAALNIGIRNAKGEIIAAMDGHSLYERSYISKCVEYLERYNADNVGGRWLVLPRESSLFGKAAASSLAHIFGVGNAHYRLSKFREPRWVDTVPFGCFRKSLFDKVGLFDENFSRTEDIEFNYRLRRSGHKILLVPDIVIYYYARSTLRGFCEHNFKNGLEVGCFLKIRRKIYSIRHIVPLLFVSSILITSIASGISFLFGSSLLSFLSLFSILALYFIANLLSSIQLSIRAKDVRLFFLMPMIFIMLHLSYGAGSLVGLFKRDLKR